jgi:hypothetical protein
LARVAKAYSATLNVLGTTGPIPEGMSAATALRVARFQAAHRWRKERLAALAKDFQARHQYLPPYWELMNLAHSVPVAP